LKKLKEIKVLYLGNKLRRYGFTPTGVETLGHNLSELTNMITASDKKNKFFRLLDMIFTLIKNRNNINLVLIDTYSGSAFYYAFIISIMCRMLDVKYVPILRGGDLFKRLDENKFLSNNIFNNSFTNISPSNFIKENFNNKGYKISIIPNFIDLGFYPYLHRSSCSPSLLWVRSFHEIYNPKMAILVLNELLKEFPNANLCMVGPDKDGSLNDCVKLSNKLNIRGSVNFTGILKKEEWVKKAKEYDIFLNTTNYDNLPVSILEAMALGFPIVSTNAGGLSSFHKDKFDALIVEKEDFLTMTKNIKLLISDNSLSEKLSRNARNKAEAFGWEILKNKWKNLFLGLE